jgi:hypothetical protein
LAPGGEFGIDLGFRRLFVLENELEIAPGAGEGGFRSGGSAIGGGRRDIGDAAGGDAGGIVLADIGEVGENALEFGGKGGPFVIGRDGKLAADFVKERVAGAPVGIALAGELVLDGLHEVIHDAGHLISLICGHVALIDHSLKHGGRVGGVEATILELFHHELLGIDAGVLHILHDLLGHALHLLHLLHHGGIHIDAIEVSAAWGHLGAGDTGKRSEGDQGKSEACAPQHRAFLSNNGDKNPIHLCLRELVSGGYIGERKFSI